jgi:hypothetical protein
MKRTFPHTMKVRGHVDFLGSKSWRILLIQRRNAPLSPSNCAYSLLVLKFYCRAAIQQHLSLVCCIAFYMCFYLAGKVGVRDVILGADSLLREPPEPSKPRRRECEPCFFRFRKKAAAAKVGALSMFESTTYAASKPQHNIRRF